jgi:hypothetical protein
VRTSRIPRAQYAAFPDSDDVYTHINHWCRYILQDDWQKESLSVHDGDNSVMIGGDEEVGSIDIDYDTDMDEQGGDFWFRFNVTPRRGCCGVLDISDLVWNTSHTNTLVLLAALFKRMRIEWRVGRMTYVTTSKQTRLNVALPKMGWIKEPHHNRNPRSGATLYFWRYTA